MGKLTPAEHAERGAQATRRARGKLKAKRTRAEYLRSLTDFERSLVEARCPRHTEWACCDQCIPSKQLDSTGFPSGLIAFARGRYRVCDHCDKLAAIDQWNFPERRCSFCAPFVLVPPKGLGQRPNRQTRPLPPR